MIKTMVFLVNEAFVAFAFFFTGAIGVDRLLQSFDVSREMLVRPVEASFCDGFSFQIAARSSKIHEDMQVFKADVCRVSMF